MPLYEYRCAACGKRTEQLVLAGDSATTPICPCGSHDLTRLLSTFAAHGAHKSEGGLGDFPCGEGACESPEACGMNGAPCGMGAGGFGGMGDDF